MRNAEKRIVYIVRSQSDPSRHYVGITGNIQKRVEWHNHAPAGYGTRYRPWSLVVSIEFPSTAEAVRWSIPET